ncbi:prepilin-type N-terminal cleavage/methylation domain-containing protein [Brevibacillus sp. CF112]|uniref:prepilin-type N-terminal cleavage/methylation domain-containing protein n=1 Tax=Brevibacillus TaxID=55080 RepID=UPI0002715D58|nr:MULTISPECIES: prepilin-type N-terminal cleavage/methylation domain-containing protein [Brevibacillus]EJL45648.1 prepilin-type N-terminal cleavage/methylation domain-containing protein [Brevibacillus sp. CF112]MCG5254036.1 prepilin-type N-terminal cleavage/methylation domain-containing protein [Brevibacillus agri]
MLKKILKNERGLTLIELLAVIVIIGIIAAIAVPSIGNIIENSRRDAHVANARMLIDATKMRITTNQLGTTDDDRKFTLAELRDWGLIQDIRVPGDNGSYDGEDSFVRVERDADNNILTYHVTLAAAGSAEPFIDNVELQELTRAVVDLDRNGTPDNAQ